MVVGGSPLRIAVALSGGVDSSVTALILRRCIHSRADLEALLHTGFPSPTGVHDRWPAPSPAELTAAVMSGTPWTRVVQSSAIASPSSEPAEAGVVLVPFFMRTWSGEDGAAADGWCAPAEREWRDAQAVAHSLRLVPRDRSLTVVDLGAAYAERCFDPMVAAYARGETLNVDVLCNSEVKFGALVDEHLRWWPPHNSPAGNRGRISDGVQGVPGALRAFSPFDAVPCDMLATGHYARTLRLDRPTAAHSPPLCLLRRPLTAGSDLNDQTVFLARVRPCVWPRLVFPLGHLFRTKADVRRLCAAYGDTLTHAKTDGHRTEGVHCSDAALWRSLAHKKTSTGLCFVGEAAVRQRPRRRAAPAVETEATAAAVGCATGTSPPPHASCSHAFARFLSEYVAAPCATRAGEGTEASATTPLTTRLVEVDTAVAGDGTSTSTAAADAGVKVVRELSPSLFDWDGLPPCDTPAAPLLPSYAFTVGQRLRCSHGAVPASYYVARKVHHQGLGGGTRSVRELQLVREWNHPLLLASRIATLTEVHVQLPRALLGRLSSSAGGAAQRVPCWGCTRHQEPPRPCWLTLRWDRGEEGEPEGAVEVAGPHHAIRAVTAGQLFVAYMPSSWVVAAAAASAAGDDGDDEDTHWEESWTRMSEGFYTAAAAAPGAHTSATAPPTEMVVVASGWVGGDVAPDGARSEEEY